METRQFEGNYNVTSGWCSKDPSHTYAFTSSIAKMKAYLNYLVDVACENAEEDQCEHGSIRISISWRPVADSVQNLMTNEYVTTQNIKRIDMISDLRN